MVKNLYPNMFFTVFINEAETLEATTVPNSQGMAKSFMVGVKQHRLAARSMDLESHRLASNPGSASY